MTPNIRVLRIPLPVELIQKMDAVVLEGRAGLGSRADLIREAVEAMVLELTYGVDDAAPLASASTRPPRSASPPPPDPPLRASAADGADAETGTALGLPPRPAALASVSGTPPRSNGPLFGMHNRDYPSLWVARRLCDLVHAGSCTYDAAVAAVVKQAWTMG